MQELNFEQIEEVSAGIRGAAIGWAVGKVLDAAASTFFGWGSTDPDWGLIGASQMTA
jgi:hypothetical protein